MSEPALHITINRVPYTLPAGATLADAVAAAGLSGPFAAAVNLQFVPRARHAEHRLAEQDAVELIVPITGG